MSLERTPSTIEYFLQVLDDDGNVVREIPVAGLVKIGRDSRDLTPDVVIPTGCPSVSRGVHAVIELGGDQPVLTDKSRLGTIVNGRRIEHASAELQHGDEVVFGLVESGWRVRLRVSGQEPPTHSPDPLEMLVVSENPRKVRIGRRVVEEHLGGFAFRLLKLFAENKGSWYRSSNLAKMLWPDPDKAPELPDTALSGYKKDINDLLRPYLKGQDAIQEMPYLYRMKPRLEDTQTS